MFEDLASRVVLAFHDPRASGVVVRGQGNEDHEVTAAGGVHVNGHRKEPGVDLAEAENGDDDSCPLRCGDVLCALRVGLSVRHLSISSQQGFGDFQPPIRQNKETEFEWQRDHGRWDHHHTNRHQNRRHDQINHHEWHEDHKAYLKYRAFMLATSQIPGGYYAIRTLAENPSGIGL